MHNLSSDEVLSAVAPRAAVDALREVLQGGFDPATDPHRQKVALPHGEMHLLPSALDGAVGVKALGIQPAGSTVDVPLVQGSYLLMGGKTLTPEVVMDAAALTEVRTPAVAVAGCWTGCGRRVSRWSASSSVRVCRGRRTHGGGRAGGGAGGVGDVCVEKPAGGSAAPVGGSRAVWRPMRCWGVPGWLWWRLLRGNLWSSIGSCELMRPCWLWGRTPWARGSCMRMCCGAAGDCGGC